MDGFTACDQTETRKETQVERKREQGRRLRCPPSSSPSRYTSSRRECNRVHGEVLVMACELVLRSTPAPARTAPLTLFAGPCHWHSSFRPSGTSIHSSDTSRHPRRSPSSCLRPRRPSNSACGAPPPPAVRSRRGAAADMRA
jgi:hypothetical protein